MKTLYIMLFTIDLAQHRCDCYKAIVYYVIHDIAGVAAGVKRGGGGGGERDTDIGFMYNIKV